MKLEHIELSQLKTSPLNVRKRGGKDDLPELMASIRSLGIIQPLLVRMNCEGYEVIAGQRRLLALQRLRDESGMSDPVPCAVMEDGDDARAVEASLAENIARLPMDEIDQYEAFAALKAQGRTIGEIAGQFGVTELLVKRRLAIAGLIPPVLNAYRKDEIEPETIQQLTMATPAQQKAWMKLFRDPDDYAPTGRRLKAWLFGGAEIPASSALFPEDQYTGTIVSDLFGEGRFFDDTEKFWKLQTEAIIQRQAAYLEAGWSDVVILDIGVSFAQWSMVKRGKRKGGKVYISCAANGEIGFHEGWLDEKEAARRDKAQARSEAGAAAGEAQETEAAPVKAELTAAAVRYCDLHRQNAVRVELLGSPMMALRLMAASIIGSVDLWNVRPEAQHTNGNKDIAASLDGSSARVVFDAERAAMVELLGLRPNDAFLLESGGTDTCTLFARLMAMTDSEVIRILTYLMAESLPAGSAEVEVLGHILAVDMGKWWTPDDTFFALLRDKPAINAMLAEVGGKENAFLSVSDTATNQKKVIQHCLAGTGGHKQAGPWVPRYFRFPMQSYTKRRGLPAMEKWTRVKKLFEKKQ